MADETTGGKATKAPTKQEAAEAIVEKWVSDNIRNTPFSQDTAAWNHFFNALPKLVDAIVKGE